MSDVNFYTDEEIQEANEILQKIKGFAEIIGGAEEEIIVGFCDNFLDNIMELLTDLDALKTEKEELITEVNHLENLIYDLQQDNERLENEVSTLESELQYERSK